MTDKTGTEKRCVLCDPNGHPSNCLTSEIERLSGAVAVSSAARVGCIDCTRREKRLRARHDEDGAFGSSDNEIVGMLMLSNVGDGGGLGTTGAGGGISSNGASRYISL